MVTSTIEDLRHFADAVDGVLSAVWPHPRTAGDDVDGSRMRAVWDAAAGHGWTDLATDGALDAVVTALGRLGRAGCPLPLMDAYVAGWLGVEGVADGTVRPVLAVAAADVPSVRFVEAAPAATHLVLLHGDEVVVRGIAGVTATPGLAKPSWSQVRPGGDVVWRASPGRQVVEHAKALLRLGLVARAAGAASRAVEFAVEHAKQRVAFGKPIGAYQAVSHRAADGATDMSAAHALIREAVAAHLAGRPDWPLAVQLAVHFAGPAAVRAQFGAQHTLAASGYFEEHDAPWLFRRVNADVSLLDGIPLEAGDVADMVIAGGGLPALELGERAESFRREVRAFLEGFRRDRAVVHMSDRDPDFERAAAANGYLALGWPAAAGGREAGAEEQMVLAEELAYQRIPSMAKAAADMLGTAILRHATAEQQARFLPLLAAGDFPFYLGYSEPEYGSDLANLRTRAVRDGDEWVVDGRKMWGTNAHTAEWVWLAARTDPAARPPHTGITVFLTRLDRPGFTAQRHTALSGEISCSTFFDGFRIPDADRIGEVGGGWRVISEALAQERVVMASSAASVLRMLDDLLAEVRRDPAATVGPPGSAKRELISELAARLQAARVLVGAGVRATATTGGGARLEAPMAKILASRLMEDFGEAALRILGPAAALGEGVPGVPGGGAFEYHLRLSIMHVVGGGTIDIQRNLVARALGLPR